MPGICIAFSFPSSSSSRLVSGSSRCNLARQGSRVVMLNVGQGDSMLVQSGKANMLVDHGREGRCSCASLPSKA